MTPLEATQRTLAGEHAAVYVYGVLGAQTSQSGAPALFTAITAAYTAHRSLRDELIEMVVALGGTPVAAAAAYDVPARLDRERDLTRLAAQTEDRCAATYAFWVAGTATTLRRRAIAALNESAVRVLAFRGTPEMFPGAGEYADR